MTRRGFEMLGLISQVGISVVFTIGLATWAGSYLDERFSSRPYLTLVFAVIGIAAAFMNINKLLNSFFSPRNKRGGGR